MRMASIFVALLAAAGFVLLWQPSWLVAALARRSPDVLHFASTSEPMAALTIDDGPDPQTTPEILHVLAAPAGCLRQQPPAASRRKWRRRPWPAE